MKIKLNYDIFSFKGGVLWLLFRRLKIELFFYENSLNF